MRKMYVSRNVKNFLKMSKFYKPLYEWRKDGVYVLFGPLEDKNIEVLWRENREFVEEFFERIFDADDVPLKTLIHTNEVWKYLKEKETY
jgi:hypothetical protein